MSGNATISNSQQIDKVATDNGAAIHFVPLDGNGRTLDIRNTTIFGNSAGDSPVDRGVGGGVFVDGSDATAVFDTVLISNNEAGDSGGGVYSFESGLLETDSTFTGNMAFGSDSGGGGRYVLGAGLVSQAFSVIGGLFNSNNAIQGGGGIYKLGSLQLQSTAISGNSAVQGAGLLNSSNATVVNSTVLLSSGSEGPGVTNFGTLSLTDSEVLNNDGTEGGGVGTDGTMTILRSTIAGKRADYGAGVLNSRDLVVSDSTISGNTASGSGGFGYGGDILNDYSGQMTIRNTTISGNVANDEGGGVHAGSGGEIPVETVTIHNSIIVGNRSDADGNGGSGSGVSTNTGAQMTLFNTLVAGNLRGASRSTTPDDIGNGTVDSASSFNLISDPGVARSTIGVGELAQSETIVDIDSDGDRDVLVASDGSNTLAILTNEGGSFVLEEEILLVDRPQSVAAWESSDLTSKLIAVAAIGTTANGGSVFTLNGSLSTIEGGNGPIDVVIDDFDNNGLPDIAFGTLRSSNRQLLINGEATATTVATARQMRTVTSGDVNGDGNADLLLGGHGDPLGETADLLVLLGDGLGEFSEPFLTATDTELVDLQVVPLLMDPIDNDLGEQLGQPEEVE